MIPTDIKGGRFDDGSYWSIIYWDTAQINDCAECRAKNEKLGKLGRVLQSQAPLPERQMACDEAAGLLEIDRVILPL